MRISALLILLSVGVGAQAGKSDFVCQVGDRLEVELPNGITKLWCMLENEFGEHVETGRSIYVRGDVIIVEVHFDEQIRLHGLFQTRDETGEVTSRGYYKRGEKVGDWLEWNKDTGELINVSYPDRLDNE